MDEHETADTARRIIDEAATVAAEHGVTLNPYQRREVLRLARGWIAEGMAWRDAAERAAFLVLPSLHGIEDAPWR